MEGFLIIADDETHIDVDVPVTLQAWLTQHRGEAGVDGRSEPSLGADWELRPAI